MDRKALATNVVIVVLLSKIGAELVDSWLRAQGLAMQGVSLDMIEAGVAGLIAGPLSLVSEAMRQLTLRGSSAIGIDLSRVIGNQVRP